MAGDWIKMESDLGDKPEVHFIANSLGIDPDAVVGKLHRVWVWFDKHTHDGNAVGVSVTLVDRLVFVNGFGNAMSLCGWLTQDGETLTLPNFGRHNGKTAKTRALTAKRVAAHNAKANAKANEKTNDDVTRHALPREEKIYITPIVPFDDFWDAWPNKKAKKDAMKAWAKLNPDEQLAKTIMAAVREQSRWPEWNREGGRFIPRAATWLNGARWEDEPEPRSAGQSLDLETLIRSAVAADRRHTGDDRLDEAARRVGWDRLMGMDNFNRGALLGEVRAKFAEVCRG